MLETCVDTSTVTLTTMEQDNLAVCEETIKRGLATFVDVGNALLAIRDGRLYRETYGTFEVYCRERWGFEDSQTYRLMGSAKVVSNLKTSPMGEVLPLNERQARPLTRLKSPDQQREAWAKAVASAGGQPTSKQVKAVVTEMKRAKHPATVITPAAKSPCLIVARAESMLQIKSESVDLIITSPPYNLGNSDWPMGGNGRTPRGNGIGYSDSEAEDKYQQWQNDCLIEMYRVAKVGASLFYNHKVRGKRGTIIHPMDWLRNERNPWTLRQEIVWDRGSTHNHCPSLFWPEDERIYWMTKGTPRLPDRPIGIPSVWRFHGPVAGTWHPAPFPPELPRRCIEAVGREGIVVLDPFAGSGTTLKVALEYGYDAIGVDISVDYLKKAAMENGWTKANVT